MNPVHSSFRSISAKSVFLPMVFFVGLAHAQKQPTAPSFALQPQASPAEQANFPPELLQQLSAIKADALVDDYAYRQVAHLTDNIGPRPSGSLQAKAAVDYVAGELRQLGLDVHLEEVKVPH
jgi:hypothetical protein